MRVGICRGMWIAPGASASSASWAPMSPHIGDIIGARLMGGAALSLVLGHHRCRRSRSLDENGCFDQAFGNWDSFASLSRQGS